MCKDIIGREIAVGDYVVYYSNIYKVLELYSTGYAKIILAHRSKTTSSVKKYSKEMAILDPAHVTMWMLTNG